MKPLFVTLISLLILAVLGLLTFSYLYISSGPLDQNKTVYIESGSGFRGIVRQLEEEGVISNQYIVALPALLLGQRKNFKPGEYIFQAHSSPQSVLNKLVSGEIVRHKITIPEGLTSQQIIALVNAEPLLKGEITSDIAEGSLLPETYQFTRGDTKESILRRMQQSMQTASSELWKSRQQGLPFNTLDEAITLASIVEKEARLPEERAHIAAVYINRLNKGMKLQADPTTIYAIELEEGRPIGRLLYKSDLLRNLPHNTYANEGLPPTPICNPGKDAIAATLNPMSSEDIFFVARGDGGHFFAKTYRQHLQNIQRYRDAQRINTQ